MVHIEAIPEATMDDYLGLGFRADEIPAHLVPAAASRAATLSDLSLTAPSRHTMVYMEELPEATVDDYLGLGFHADEIPADQRPADLVPAAASRAATLSALSAAFNASTLNRFAALTILDDKEFPEVFPTWANNYGDQRADDTGREGVKRIDLPKAKPAFKTDQSVKRLVITPVQENDLEVFYPPMRVESVQRARKASTMRQGGSYATKVGIAKVVYGSYGDGDIQA